jgi:hypothetical protein
VSRSKSNLGSYSPHPQLAGRGRPRTGGGRVVIGALVLVGSSIMTSACRHEEPTVVPVLSSHNVGAAAPLATASSVATSRPTTAVAATTVATGTVASGEIRLPADPEAVVVQVGRVHHSPWEPAILAQMRPDFSLQSSGYGVFTQEGGPSVDGWYQTALSPVDTLNFVKLLVDDVGILDLAQRRGEPKLNFTTKVDGSPGDTTGVVVVYVKTAGQEARLVIPEAELANPTGPDAVKIEKLGSVLTALELWQSGVGRTYTPEEAAAIARNLGWWTDTRQPYSPDIAVAFGTNDLVTAPADAPAAAWPLETTRLGEAFDVPFGKTPSELALKDADAVAVVRADGSRPASFWGPLWTNKPDSRDYLVGVRVAPPGSNHMVLDYSYAPPPILIGEPTPTTPPAATVTPSP